MHSNLSRFAGLGLFLLCTIAAGLARAESFVMILAANDERTMAVTVHHPTGGCADCTLVVFSHGAYAAPERYERLLDAWTRQDFVVVSPLHVDSELHPDRDKYSQEAVLPARLEDYGVLLTSEQLREELKKRNLQTGPGTIAAGHSYGGLIAQVAGGASMTALPEMPAAFVAARESVLGVLALSPPGPFGDFVSDEDWSAITRPMLVVTGTTDVFPGFVDDWRLHLRSFEASRQAPAYALVYTGQDHYFNGSFGRPTDELADGDVQALAALNQACIEFMGDLVRGAMPAADAWRQRSTDLVQALANESSAEETMGYE